MFMKPIDAPRRAAAGGVRAPGWRMIVRALTALVGGYAAAAALATLLARLLPIERSEATLWGMLSSFLLYAGVVLWCFREPRLGRVVAAVWGSAFAAAGAVWLLGVRP